MASPMNDRIGADSSDDPVALDNFSTLANGHPEPDSTTNGYPDELEEVIRQSLQGSSVSVASSMSTETANPGAVPIATANGDSQKEQTEQAGGSKNYVTQAESLLNINELDELNRLISSDPNASVVVDGFELPKSLIITNIDSRVFQVGTEERAQFEETFRAVDSTAIFLYFRSFRRARVDFSASVYATKARILCNQQRIGEENINVYYAEIAEVPIENRHLRPPALEKQFLISPPASPPEGWQPSEEAQPVLNIDLQSALANLLPGTSHELHAATDSQPGIFVHICPDTTSAKQAAALAIMDNMDDDGTTNEDDGGTAAVESNFSTDEPDINVSVMEEVDECMVSGQNSAPSFGMINQVFGGVGGGGNGLSMSRKIPHTACPPSMSSLASAARREDN